MVEGIRSFIAIEIPHPLLQKIGEIQRSLKSSGADVKWVRPEGIHLTLKFLGSISGEELKKLSLAIEPIITAREPFELKIIGLGCFPSLRNPRVLWVGIDNGSQEVSALQESIEKSAIEAGFLPENRPFSPHLTLGRFRSSRNKNFLTQAFENLKNEGVGNFWSTEVHLFKSELKPTGAVYTKLETYAMKK